MKASGSENKSFAEPLTLGLPGTTLTACTTSYLRFRFLVAADSRAGEEEGGEASGTIGGHVRKLRNVGGEAGNKIQP